MGFFWFITSWLKVGEDDDDMFNSVLLDNEAQASIYGDINLPKSIVDRELPNWFNRLHEHVLLQLRWILRYPTILTGRTMPLGRTHMLLGT